MSRPISRRGFSVTVFLPTGDPEGLKVVEKWNWSGLGLVIPKAIFGESKGREELGRTGVYLLVGPGDTSALPTVYVGQGDLVRPRIEEHVGKKDFWTHAVVFTSKDSNLNKAHVHWLESRLVELARKAKRCVLANGNTPGPPSLSGVDEAMTEGFLDDMLLCLPILGFSMFETGSAAIARGTEAALRLAAKGIEAWGKETAAGFVVLEKSQAVGDDKIAPALEDYDSSVKRLRDELIQQGVMAPDGEGFVFTQDYIFTSPSKAASALLGGSSNGRLDWKTKDGRTLKEVQEAEVSG